VAVLGVAGGERAPGAERLEVVELEAVAAEVELDVLGERAVSDGQDEAVATDPLVVIGVAAHDLLEEEISGGCKAHRGAGVTVSDLLHGVCRKNSGGVYGLVVDGIPLESCHVIDDPSYCTAANQSDHCGEVSACRRLINGH
jgi:hypothetical protein